MELFKLFTIVIILFTSIFFHLQQFGDVDGVFLFFTLPCNKNSYLAYTFKCVDECECDTDTVTIVGFNFKFNFLKNTKNFRQAKLFLFMLNKHILLDFAALPWA